MKSFALLTSEAKPPLQLVSLFHFFVSEAASFLHQPRRGGFIAKSPCRSKCFLPGRNPAVVTLRSGSEAARFAHREVLRLTPQSEVKRSAIVPQAHFTREARLHVRRTLHVPRKRNASLQKALAFASAFCLAGAEGLEQALLRCPKIAAGDGAPLRFSTAAPAAPRCFRPRRRSVRPPGTLLVPRVHVFRFWPSQKPPIRTAFGLAGAEGLEPSALGFGDRCSTN